MTARTAVVAAVTITRLAWACALAAQEPRGLASGDLPRLRGLGDVQLSPDGRRVAYAVTRNDRGPRSSSETWIRDLATGATTHLGQEGRPASTPRWSPDGRFIAFLGRIGDSSGVAVANADGSGMRFLAATAGTNAVLPSTGSPLTWSPDGRQLAFVSTEPGPEADANGDPMVITRYAYKPTASEGLTRFNDNRRTHIYVVDVATRAVRQITRGTHDEHSISWSPRGDEIAFISNPEADPDRVFNYDVFAVNVASGAVRSVVHTKSAEYDPAWSPDGRQLAYLGTKRDLTSSETTMEDTHVWVVAADGSDRRELGAAVDNRQGSPQWARDGQALYAAVQERGVQQLWRFGLDGRAARVATGDGSVNAWSVAAGGSIALAAATPAEPAVLRLADARGVRDLLALNGELLASRTIAPVERFTFAGTDGREVEAFLTLPLGRTARSSHPLIAMIHGGPHGAQGPAFNYKAQVYAAHGYGVLMVNYRGSTGYGQAFADAIFGDQDGREAEDVVAGVDAALARWPFLDRERLGIEGGSYGGQLTNWIITRTGRFKAAVPIAGISNLVSFNYTAYYHDYLAVEFGRFPHQDGLMDTLWARSPLRYADRVRTPTMFVHGENDNDVPIAEAEQFFVALKDVGVETTMVRYPREGHGIREIGHQVDLAERSMAWYDRWFAAGRAPATQP